MKTIISLILLLLSLSSLSFAQNETMDNKKIIELTNQKLGDKLIIDLINDNNCNFTTDINSILELKKNNVSEDVIGAMRDKKKNVTNAENDEAGKSDPNNFHKPGIYYYNANATNPVQRIDASVSSSAGSGGGGYGGFGGSSTESRVAGLESTMQIDQASPVFYFYFKSDENPNADNWFFASATSPKEFVLVKFIVNKKNNCRLFKTGSTNHAVFYSGSSSGIPEKVKVPFTMTEVKEGIFKVTFSKSLDGGEYCFTYASSAPSRYNNNKVFDFGIK